MSATNRTTNYNLPIFIETDKPAWLVDFNGAMRSIDAQMKTNADAIATKSPILTFNDTADIDFTKSGDIVTANLSSGIAGTISRAMVKPVSAPASQQFATIDATNNQQMVSIGNGLTLENNTLNAIDLNLTDTGTPTLTTNYGTILNNSLRYALNSDASIGKIYGYISVSGLPSSGACVLTTNIYAEATGEAYNIFPTGITLFGNSYQNSGVILDVAADGRISIRFAIYGSVAYLYIMPCIYFFANFGDTPI